MNIFSTIKDRVVQFAEYKGIAKETFFTEIGMTSANFRGNAKKTPLNSNAIENIFAKHPDINLYWLLTGEGGMLRVDDKFSPEGDCAGLLAEKESRIEELKDHIKTLQTLVDVMKQNSEPGANSG